MISMNRPVSGPLPLLKSVAAAVTGALLIAASAKIQIPFWPVPMTLQTLTVLGLPVLLGPRIGLAAMATYLTAGAAGLPVFANSPERGLGLAYLAGPTGGYLLGFLIAAGVTGWLAQARSWAGQALAMLAGLAVIYAAGLAWLAAFLPASQLLQAGFTPFILADLVKIALAVALLTGWRRIRERSA